MLSLKRASVVSTFQTVYSEYSVWNINIIIINARTLVTHLSLQCGDCLNTSLKEIYSIVFQTSDVRDPELWCDERDTGEYPSSLYVPLPTNMDLATKPPDRTNSAIQAATPTKAFALLTSAFVLLSLIGLEGI